MLAFGDWIRILKVSQVQSVARSMLCSVAFEWACWGAVVGEGGKGLLGGRGLSCSAAGPIGGKGPGGGTRGAPKVGGFL